MRLPSLGFELTELSLTVWHVWHSDLQRRGCPRTSFELARLLLALDPYTDPHGSLFHLEYLAIKTDMGQWLLDLTALYDNAVSSHKSEKRGSFDVASLPGWAYSKALALRAREVTNKDTVSLLLSFFSP